MREAGPRRRAVAGRVDAVRRGLAPICDPRLLAVSLLREAGLPEALASETSPLRIGYATRYLELTGEAARRPSIDPPAQAPRRHSGCLRDPSTSTTSTTSTGVPTR